MPWSGSRKRPKVRKKDKKLGSLKDEKSERKIRNIKRRPVLYTTKINWKT